MNKITSILAVLVFAAPALTANVVTKDAAQTVPLNDITTLLEDECFDSSHPDYDKWISVGKPACWCYRRQCYGDADGLKEGASYLGYYYVGSNDLGILANAWKVREPPYGPGIASIPNGICADFNRDKEGTYYIGYYRVGSNDLGTLATYWKINEPPKSVEPWPDGMPSTGCGGQFDP